MRETIPFILLFMLPIVLFAAYKYSKKTSNVKSEEINKSLYKLMNKISAPRADFQFDSKLYETLQNNVYNEKILYQLALQILAYCGITPHYITVHAILANHTPYDQTVAGMITSDNYGNANIDIIIKDYYTAKEVVAILIHECMHYYLRNQNIVFQDTRQNEILTDTAAVYLGFGYHLEEGYFKAQAGYIDYNGIHQIRQIIDKINRNEPW